MQIDYNKTEQNIVCDDHQWYVVAHIFGLYAALGSSAVVDVCAGG